MIATIVVVFLELSGAELRAQLTFNFTPTGNSQVDAGFQAAGNFWSSIFDDDIQINVNTRFEPLDGGLTPAADGLDHFSTGEFFGDGNYAGHWKDNLGLGILDPTA